MDHNGDGSGNRTKKIYKTGTQKRAEKRKKEFEAAASDPKQRRLFELNLMDAAKHDEVETVIGLPSTADVELQKTVKQSEIVPAKVDQQVDSRDSEGQSTLIEDTLDAEDNLDERTALLNVPLQDLTKFVPPSRDASISEKLAFMNFHPVQPSEIETKLSFSSKKAYFRQTEQGKEQLRKWLSFCKENSKMFCAVCMVFSENLKSPFVNGLLVQGPKHLYSAISEHEKSKSHEYAVTAYLKSCSEKNIDSVINKDLLNKRKAEVEIHRKIVLRLIDIVLFIGKQGIAYRGTEETAATLDNKSLNHGNFLELVLLVAKYDHILNDHIETAIRNSKKRLDSLKSKGATGSVGRGSLVTLLSKSFVNKIILCLSNQIQLKIADEIKAANNYSIEVDTTQDISVIDQLALCVRYIFEDSVKVRFLRMTAAQKSTGEALHEQVKSNLNSLGLATEKIIGCSFDGAANMKGQYNGLQAHLKKDNPDLVYVHCFAHNLNLIMTNCTESCKVAKDFLGLLQSTAVFISESHKRMQVWTSVNKNSTEGHELLRRLQRVNVTRWWSKDKALESVIDDFNVPFEQSKRFLTLLKCLSSIANSNDFIAEVNFKAQSLLENWCKFQNILMAFVFRDLFNSTTPTSLYLQTRDLNYLVANNMIKTLKNNLQDKRNNFFEIYNHVKNFVKYAQNNLDECELDITLEIDLPKKRVKIAKRLAGEITSDESRRIFDLPAKQFEIEVFNVILDNAQQQLDKRFVVNEELMKNIAWLDPRNFESIVNQNKYEINQQKMLAKLAELTKVNHSELVKELHQFAIHYNDYHDGFIAIDHNEEDKCNTTAQDTYCKCNRCLVCAMKILYKLNVYGSMYTNLYIVYCYVLTLSCTQVSCERIFSILKIIKNRLRSALSQELLESFILLYIERDFEYNYDDIIDTIAFSSKEMARLLKG